MGGRKQTLKVFYEGWGRSSVDRVLAKHAQGFGLNPQHY